MKLSNNIHHQLLMFLYLQWLHLLDLKEMKENLQTSVLAEVMTTTQQKRDL